VKAWLEYGDVVDESPDSATLRGLLAAGTPFWFDVEDPTEETIDALAEALALHPLAVEDSKEFDQSGKLVMYGPVAMFVGFGIDVDTGSTVEVHGYLSDGFIVTFRRAPSAALERLHRSGSVRPLLGGEPVRILHHLASELHDDIPGYIDRLDDRVQAVEEAMLIEPLDQQLAEISEIRQHASELRRTLTPGRDMAVRLLVTGGLPGVNDDAQLYVSDLADELRLIVSDLVALGERCVSAINLHASLASNRQADASRRLAAVATVFLPITFVVGFFGQNFTVLTDDFEVGWAPFLIFGVALNVVCAAITLVWLRRRRLL
jgi:magnesium transporter